MIICRLRFQSLTFYLWGFFIKEEMMPIYNEFQKYQNNQNVILIQRKKWEKRDAFIQYLLPRRVAHTTGF